jgi:rod shape-determining protein MreC
LLSVVSLLLVFSTEYYPWADPLKARLSAIATPFYWVADIPARLASWSDDKLVSREVLSEENARLKSEALLLRAKVQKLASLEAENVRLRELLNSSALLDDTVLVAELIGLSPDPLRHEIIINKGSEDEVYVGQPVIDAQGLMGQVVEASLKYSRVLLISDATHSVPVQVNRNGVRSILEGTGLYQEMQLSNVAATTDIKVGDLLITSGLGNRFPVGYPVATVTEVSVDPGQPFATVKAAPSAQLIKSRHVLLVFTTMKEK